MSDPRFLERLLKYANSALLVSVLAVVVTVLMAYPLADLLPMPAQIGAHIATLLFATTLKLSYVTRLVSLYHLGRPVH